jgi:tetratricopeptide (TPR) repeat protein
MAKWNVKTRGNVRSLLIAAAIAAVPVFASQSAQAQYPVNNDGRARDANNRVGGNGINSGGGGRSGVVVTGNQIVTGNVTRGQAFQGPVPYTDPTAFRGPTAGFTSDRFIRDSSGAAVRGAPNLNSTYTPQAFYGQSRAVAPPPGTIPLGTQGGFVTPTQGQLDYSLVKTQTFANPWAYSAVGATNSTFGGSAAGLGTTYLQSSVPGQARDSRRFLLSPLAGIRAVPGLADGDFSVGADGTISRGNRMSVAEMRNELMGTGILANTVAGTSTTPLPAGQSQQGTLQSGSNASSAPGSVQVQGAAPIPGAAPLQGSPASGANNGSDAARGAGLTPGTLDNSVGGGTPLPGTLNTGQGVRRDLPPPSQQSTQYNEMRERFEKARGHEMSDQEAQQQFKILNRNKPGAQPGGTPAPGAPGNSGKTPAPSVLVPPMPAGGASVPAAPPGPPVEIKSLATGVQAKGLANVLKSAEELVKQGKFAAALDQYDTAEQVAPNNPMVALGKANAELGASSYRSAETHIRQAVGTDPALLMGKYDLRTFIGDERLRVLITDLADLAKGNPDEATAPFLLSYIMYNTGNAPLAASWLNDAERRTGAKPDPTIQAMRKLWTLPATAAPANK